MASSNSRRRTPELSSFQRILVRDVRRGAFCFLRLKFFFAFSTFDFRLSPRYSRERARQKLLQLILQIKLLPVLLKARRCEVSMLSWREGWVCSMLVRPPRFSEQPRSLSDSVGLSAESGLAG